MRSPRAVVVATAIPLILTSLRVTAGEIPFSAPTTQQASANAPLFHKTAQALHASFAGVSGGDQQISHLWLFPTADTHTVFARYNLTSIEEGPSGPAEIVKEHLAVLTVDGNRIVESHELTSSDTKSVSKNSASLDWSATLGTGYAAHPGMTNVSHGEPASPHWTANIGTGTAATSAIAVSDTKGSASSAAQPIIAVPDWTSRIGRGDAFESSRRVSNVPWPPLDTRHFKLTSWNDHDFDIQAAVTCRSHR